MTRYPITPVPKPRMTRSDRWQKRPAVMRYWAFCDACRMHDVELPEAGARVTFVLPMPKSWTKYRRSQMDGQPHQAKPDTTNLLKALEDALHQDDSGIWHYAGVEKRWGREGEIVIHMQDEAMS